MARQRRMWTVFVVLVSLLVASTSWAAVVSGTLTNSSGKTGRAYIMLKDQYGNSNGFGTSLLISSGSGDTTFTLSGITPGQYQLSGYLDTRSSDPLARGHIFSGSPLIGNSDLFTVTTSDKNDLSYTISAAPAQSVVTPVYIDATPMDEGLFVTFDTPYNASNIEIAESYNIYWSTSPSPSASQMAGGGSLLGIPSVDDGHQGISGLVNGTGYYVAIEAVLGATKSGLTTNGPITVGEPADGFTLSGAVNFSGITPDKPLIIIAYSDGGMYLKRIASPAVSQSYTIKGVQAGTYNILAFLDQNDNGRIDAGDLISGFDSMLTSVSTDMSLPNITLVNQEVYSSLTTRHNNFGQGDYYYLDFYFEGGAKRPAHIDIISGPNMGITSVGINSWGEFQLSYPVPRPLVGDSYSAIVYFTDGTSLPVNGLDVTGRVDVLPVVTYPVGSTGTDGTSPRFAWYLTGLPSGNYSQNVQLYNNNGDDWQRSVPITQNSYQYDGPTLASGVDYNGQVEISDPFGNVSQSYIQFKPTANTLTVTGVTPNALACGSTTPIIISGTGFNTDFPANNFVYFNSNSNTAKAQVNSATATQLSVTLPACASGAVATGPVKVTTNIAGNDISAVQPGDFTPQIFYDYYVRNSSGTGLSDVVVEVDGNPGISTTSLASPLLQLGNYKLSGIPSGLPFQQKLSLSGYAPSYSARMINFTDYTNAGNFGLFTELEVANWGVSNGKGLIRSRVTGSSSTDYLGGGAVVTAYSTFHDSSSYYTVAYTGEGTTSTSSSDGRYNVLNVEEGDTVVVTASKSGLTFDKRTFVTHANSVSQGRITGTPTVSVSGMNPSTAPTGSTVVINGNNFNINPNQNTICFKNNWGGTNCTNPSVATMTQLTVTVPCYTGTGAVTVTSNGQAVNAGTFTVPSPAITGFTPANGPAGMPVTITGTGFSSGSCSGETSVTFAGMQYQQITSTSPTQIVFNSPYVATTTIGTISVTTMVGTATSSASYTAYPTPNVTGMLNPDMAAPGEQVTVSGTFYDFNTDNYGVTIGGVPAVVSSVDASGLVFTVPGNAGSGGQVIGTYYGFPSYGPMLTVIYHLSAAITGEGNINSVNGLGGLACILTSCSANYYYAEPASLGATPSAGYDFSGWNGDCGGTGSCDMSMTTNKAVTAIFTVQPNVRVGTSSTYYGTIQAAFNAAVVNNELRLQGLPLVFGENPNYSRPAVGPNPAVTTTLKGGWDPGFTLNPGMTVIRGRLDVRDGRLNVQQIAVRANQ